MILMMLNAVIITAAGCSQRFGSGKKEYRSFSVVDPSVTVLSQCVAVFASTSLFSRVVITVPQGDVQKVKLLLQQDKRLCFEIPQTGLSISVIEGGGTRQESVYNALCFLQSCAEAYSYVFIHDGARPWVSDLLVKNVYAAVQQHGAVVPAVAVTDTQKEVGNNGIIIRHLTRSTVVAVQTPQAFLFLPLLKAYSKAANDGKVYTDDSEVYAVYCKPVYTCVGMCENKKITYWYDLPQS